MDIGGETYYFPRERSERLSQPRAYITGEGFDQSALPSEQRAVVDFYDKKVDRYFEKLRKGNVERIRDENGFEWLETQITPQDMQAVEAFQTDLTPSDPSKDIFYHGTDYEFDKFDQREALQRGETGNNVWGQGFYVTKSLKTAENYGKIIMKFRGGPQNILDLSKFGTIEELAEHLDISPDILTVTRGIPTARGTWVFVS